MSQCFCIAKGTNCYVPFPSNSASCGTFRWARRWPHGTLVSAYLWNKKYIGWKKYSTIVQTDWYIYTGAPGMGFNNSSLILIMGEGAVYNWTHVHLNTQLYRCTQQKQWQHIRIAHMASTCSLWLNASTLFDVLIELCYLIFGASFILSDAHLLQTCLKSI